MAEDRISVIIPTRNRAQEVLQAIESVRQQTVTAFEIIVVDDGSTDDTAEQIRRARPEVIIVSNPVSLGGAAARNRGADAATGDYLAFLDSDDVWLPQHLAYVLEKLKTKKADGIFTSFMLHKNGVHTEVKFFSNEFPQGQLGNYIFSFRRFDARTSTFFFERKAFLATRFDDGLKKHQDWDLAIRFDQKYRFVFDARPSVQINVESGKDRMSHSFNHEATYYFLNRIKPYVAADYRFAFCLKQIMRCQLSGVERSVVQRYIDYIGSFRHELAFKNRVIYVLLKNRLLNIGLIYRLIRKVK